MLRGLRACTVSSLSAMDKFGWLISQACLVFFSAFTFSGVFSLSLPPLVVITRPVVTAATALSQNYEDRTSGFLRITGSDFPPDIRIVLNPDSLSMGSECDPDHVKYARVGPVRFANSTSAEFPFEIDSDYSSIEEWYVCLKSVYRTAGSDLTLPGVVKWVHQGDRSKFTTISGAQENHSIRLTR